MAAHLIVIGAMKSGTTTFYNDLDQHHDVALAPKESQALRRVGAGNEHDREAYLAQWPADARARVEVETTYSMAPHIPGVAGKASVLVPDAKILYLVRDPIDRALSHHHHDFSSGVVSGDVNDVIRNDPRLLDYSRYATQVRRWLDEFPTEQVRIVRFEDYVDNRAQVLRGVLNWIGLPALPRESDLTTRHNVGTSRRTTRGVMRGIVTTGAYRRFVRPYIPERVHAAGRRALVPVAPPRPNGPSEETLRFMVERLRPEVVDLAALTQGRVNWDIDQHLVPRDDR